MSGDDGGHIAERLAAVGSAAVFDALGGEGWLEGLVPVWSPAALAGPVFTVEGPPGDNLPLHRAVAEAPARSVLLAAMGGEVEAALFGDVLARIAAQRTLLGLVIDGAVRDSDGIRRLSFPVHCRGRSLRSPTKQCWGTLGEPVRIGQVSVATGDWLLADGDGVVAIPADQLTNTVAMAEAIDAREQAMVCRAMLGESTVDQLDLRHLGDSPR